MFPWTKVVKKQKPKQTLPNSVGGDSNRKAQIFRLN